MGRPRINGITETLTTLKDYLLSLGVTVYAKKTTADLMDTTNLNIFKEDETPKKADLVIVVGGDGSLLNAAHFAIDNNLPVLGVHRGRLGFLTDINPDHLNIIGQVLKKEFKEEKRTMLTMELITKNESIAQSVSLNDIVLLPGDIAQMITFDIYVDDVFVNKQRADGLIISTPTGSTAYALSGGGPILHPLLKAIELVPMFPHTLSSRPIVIQDDSEIELRISKRNTHSPAISCDGSNRVKVPLGSSIKIKKHPRDLRLIHPLEYDYYKTLREKLGWNKQSRRS